MHPTGPVEAGAREEELDPQILLILVGLPGSGKSTFANALVQFSATPATHEVGAKRKRRKWVRASQDEAPNRRRQECEALVRHGLAEGWNVVVDRVDFDPVSHFLNIAYTLPHRPLILALILSVSPSSLARRLEFRPDHPTLSDPTTALRVLAQMQREYSPPTAGGGEGFDGILDLSEAEQPAGGIWTEKLVNDIIERCRAAPGDGGVRNSQMGMGYSGGRGRGHRPYTSSRPPPYSGRGGGGWGGGFPSNGYGPLRGNQPPPPGPGPHWRPRPPPSEPPAFRSPPSTLQ